MNFTGMLVAGWLSALADDVYPWLPPWVSWLLTIPFLALLLVAFLGELLIRLLITPRKFYD